MLLLRVLLFLMALLHVAGCGGDAMSSSADSLPGDAGRGDAGEIAVGPRGGRVALLKFAVFGDVRPATLDADAAYPTATVTKLFVRIAQIQPHFVLGVGDWMYASDETHANTQLDQLLQAEKAYPGFIVHGMGNHECGKSNCPSGDETGQVRAYMKKLIPFASHAYFSFDVQTSLGEAKIVFIATNAWNTEQETWLKTVLQKPTNYTFVVRHHPPQRTDAPGVLPSEAILNGQAVTLKLYGHTHKYRHLSANEVISGNGGAPLSSKTDDFYGLLAVEQLADTNLKITEINEDGTFADSFKLTPQGEEM